MAAQDEESGLLGGEASGLTQNIDIALASFRKLGDRSGDDFVAEIAWAFDSRSGHFECDAQETGALRIERLAA
jgi:hypothetical protein